MEFKPSYNDVNDALAYRIMRDDNYVIQCLAQVGLKTERLSNAAKRIIVKDFRTYSYPRIRTSDFDCTDTFSQFVNAEGNYHRHVAGPDGENYIVVPNDDTTFKVLIRRRDYTDFRLVQEEFSSMGIEMKRTSFMENNPAVRTFFTRDNDLVTIKCQTVNTESNETTWEDIGFVNPKIDSGRTLSLGSGYTRLEQGVEKPRNPEEINAIKEYIQTITGLSEIFYTKDGELPTSTKPKPKIDWNIHYEEYDDDFHHMGIEPEIPTIEEGIDMDDDGGLSF